MKLSFPTSVFTAASVALTIGIRTIPLFSLLFVLFSSSPSSSFPVFTPSHVCLSCRLARSSDPHPLSCSGPARFELFGCLARSARSLSFRIAEWPEEEQRIDNGQQQARQSAYRDRERVRVAMGCVLRCVDVDVPAAACVDAESSSVDWRLVSPIIVDQVVCSCDARLLYPAARLLEASMTKYASRSFHDEIRF